MKMTNKRIEKSILLILLSWTLCLSGCGEMAFDKVTKVTDQTVKRELKSSKLPVVVFIHGKLNGLSATVCGPVLEEFAKAYSDKIKFVHYNAIENEKWFTNTPSEPLGQIRLYISGIREGTIKKYLRLDSHQLIGLRGQLFLFLADYIDRSSRRTSRGSVKLTKLLLDKKVLEGTGVSIIAFDKCYTGG
jgi:hypothetical protein